MPLDDNLGHTPSVLTQIGTIIEKILLNFTNFPLSIYVAQLVERWITNPTEGNIFFIFLS